HFQILQILLLVGTWYTNYVGPRKINPGKFSCCIPYLIAIWFSHQRTNCTIKVWYIPGSCCGHKHFDLLHAASPFLMTIVNPLPTLSSVSCFWTMFHFIAWHSSTRSSVIHTLLCPS